MSKTLYRKYRPKNFSEVIGQSHIVRTLQNSIKNGRVGHAYLFTGPRGTGKTSIARIFAKTVNCEKPNDAVSCEKCNACENINKGRSLDIIEIDAASNTGVDNIRELRETVALPPTLLKYKVYIIDEVHMLSSGAFNALLKTLEEPPAHVIFILATTEIHKVPETIVSRCQRFDFGRLPLENIIEKLSLIAKNENVSVEKEAFEMIALAAEGGMRDAESILGQIISLEDKNITAKEVKEILGTTDLESIFSISEKIITSDTTGAITELNKMVKEGYDLTVFTKSLINHMRHLMLLATDEGLGKYFISEMTKNQLERMKEESKKTDVSKIIEIINLLSEAQGKISSYVIPQLALEIAFIKATHTFPSVTLQEKKDYKTQEVKEKKTEIETFDVPQKSIVEPIQEVPKEENVRSTDSFDEVDLDSDKVRSHWGKLLIEIRPFNHSLSALLSNCQVLKTEGFEVTLGTPYDFYQEKLSNPENRLTVEDVFSKILGSKVRLKVITDKSLAPKSAEETEEKETKKEGEQSSILSSALELMGGEVVEG